MNLAPLLEQLRMRRDLSAAEADAVMGTIMDGGAEPAQIGALLMGLAVKGERPAEIVGFARAMRARTTPLPRAFDDVVDTCGTGGDGGGTFNVSTAAAIVLAGAGVRVAKHGNRAVSSQAGSADVFEALGVNIDAEPDQVGHALDDCRLAFFFAPKWHASMRHVGPTRRALGVRTVFNLLGPLTNPAGARRQVIGVARPEHAELMARAVVELGTDHTWVVHGAGGLDELSTLGPTKVSAIRDGRITAFYVHPSEAGIAVGRRDALAGGTAAENAAIVRRVLGGEMGPARDMVILNAAAGLVVAGRVRSLRDGAALAAESIDSGRATVALDRLREVVAA